MVLSTVWRKNTKPPILNSWGPRTRDTATLGRELSGLTKNKLCWRQMRHWPGADRNRDLSKAVTASHRDTQQRGRVGTLGVHSQTSMRIAHSASAQWRSFNCGFVPHFCPKPCNTMHLMDSWTPNSEVSLRLYRQLRYQRTKVSHAQPLG